MKPGKVIEPKSWRTWQLEKDNQEKADIVLECFRCLFFVDFSSFKCIVLEVWVSDSVRWDKEDVSTVDKEDGSMVDKAVEQDRFK